MHFPCCLAPIALPSRSSVLRFVSVNAVVEQEASERHAFTFDLAFHGGPVFVHFLLPLRGYLNNKMLALILGLGFFSGQL